MLCGYMSELPEPCLTRIVRTCSISISRSQLRTSVYRQPALSTSELLLLCQTRRREICVSNLPIWRGDLVRLTEQGQYMDMHPSFATLERVLASGPNGKLSRCSTGTKTLSKRCFESSEAFKHNI